MGDTTGVTSLSSLLPFDGMVLEEETNHSKDSVKNSMGYPMEVLRSEGSFLISCTLLPYPGCDCSEASSSRRNTFRRTAPRRRRDLDSSCFLDGMLLSGRWWRSRQSIQLSGSWRPTSNHSRGCGLQSTLFTDIIQKSNNPKLTS